MPYYQLSYFALLSLIVLVTFAASAPAPTSASTSAATKYTKPKGNADSCFPYGSAKLNADLSAPSQPREQWWCSLDQQYGFQGFSYPLEDSDCSADSNSFDKISKDFAKMKSDFGATMVRLYYPACTESSIFENVLRAGVANNMAVIAQIWFGFDGDNSVFKASINALEGVMKSSQYGAIAPYVFHSADFGSEPVGDGVDGSNYISDLTNFREMMNGYGVPAGISEDWNRPGKMSSSDGKSLGDVGTQIKANSDYAHAHIMPYYHGDLKEAQTWEYIEPQLHFLHDVVQLAGTLITETQWAWGPNTAHGKHGDSDPQLYKAYWQKYDHECALMKSLNIGWFVHTWQGESTFDMVRPDGSYVIPNWKPKSNC